MDRFYESTRVTQAIRSDEEYRRMDDAFMFKLVPNKGLIPASRELIKGMYIPRLYMHFLLGPQGRKVDLGLRITFEDAPRYLTNSEFASAVHKGWIGTRCVQSEGIRELVQQYYEADRAIVVAHERNSNMPAEMRCVHGSSTLPDFPTWKRRG